MKVTPKTVSDRVILLENQKTLSINEENTLKMLHWGMEQHHRAEKAEAELDAKRIDFISKLADDTAPQQFRSLASEVTGQLKYKFDRDWFAVSHVLETDSHYIATLDEDGRIRRYEKSLYDFRAAVNGDGSE